MSTIGKFRALFFLTFLFSGEGFAAIWGLFPREPAVWMLGFVPLAAFSGLCALTAFFLFMIGIAASTPEQLWRGPWFQYMGGVWGYKWNGKEYLKGYAYREIDGCRTFWLTLVGILGWLTNAALALLASVLVVNSAMAIAIVHSKDVSTQIEIFIAGGISAEFLVIIFLLSCGLLHGTSVGTGKVARAYFIVVAAGLFVSYLVFAPLHFMTGLQYVLWCFGVIVGTLALTATGWTLWKILNVMGLGLKHISPSVSSSRFMEKFKNATCVIVREGDNDKK